MINKNTFLFPTFSPIGFLSAMFDILIFLYLNYLNSLKIYINKKNN